MATKTEGYYGKVVGILGKQVTFDCGAVHNIFGLPESVSVGDFIMVDGHGRIWSKV